MIKKLAITGVVAALILTIQPLGLTIANFDDDSVTESCWRIMPGCPV